MSLPVEKAFELLTENYSKTLEAVESKMLDINQVECPVVHRFGPGIYIREVTIPADSFAIGHKQNFEHMNVFLKGRVTMLNEDGSTTELKAPMIFVGQPGRKIGYIHEDMVWLNIYATNETDIEKLEAHYLTKSLSWQEKQDIEKGRVDLQAEIDKQDFKKAIEELGFDEQTVKEQSENKDDMIEMPYGEYKFKIGDSKRDGKGIFATSSFTDNEVIGFARIKGKRTILGRFTNHSKDPNAHFIQTRMGDIILVSFKKINGCTGGNDGDEITVDYRQSVKLTKNIGRDQCQV